MWQEAYGGRSVAAGYVAEIMTAVDIIVWTLFLARPLRQNLTMSHGHGVDNCSLRFCGKGTIGSWGRQISDSDFLAKSAARLPPILEVCVFIRSGADGGDGDGDVDGDGDGDGDCGGEDDSHGTRST